LAELRGKAVDLAHLVMINNPPHHPLGDFGLDSRGLLSQENGEKLTFSGIGVYRPDLFAGISAEPLKLRPVLDQAIQQQRISGEKFDGVWIDIGTPERLLAMDDEFNQSSLMAD